jgi:hypothetical protein
VDAHDEDGYVATLGHVIPLSDRVSLDALGEYVSIDHFDGGTDDNEYVTGSVKAVLDDAWNLTVGYTARNIDVEGGDNVHDHLTQASAGYDFGNGLTLEAGWKGTEDADVDSDVVGGMARYQFKF